MALPIDSGQYLRWINASHGAGVQLITADEVCYFQSESKYTRVVSARREGLVRRTLKQLLTQLDPAIFRQVHRAFVVNLNQVDAVVRDADGHVILRIKGRKEIVTVSQPYTHLFRAM